MLENPGIPLPFRIQTVSLKVLDLKFKVLGNNQVLQNPFSPSTTAQYKQQKRGIISEIASPYQASKNYSLRFMW
ncbi:hypothetical protein FOXYSP1_18880 [Fusarium oxysporum f. sp. phaseoli]